MKIISLNSKYSDSQIIAHVRKGGKDEDLCLKQLYKDNYPSVISFVTKNKGTQEDGKETLQNAIIILYEKIKKGNFELTAKLSTFLFSVAKNQWYSELKKQNKFMQVEEDKEEISYGVSFQEETDFIDENEHKKALVVSIMNQLKNDCKEILVYSIYQNYSMREIAEMMGFQNEQIARNKKSKCLSYFKNLIIKSPNANKIIKALAS